MKEHARFSKIRTIRSHVQVRSPEPTGIQVKEEELGVAYAQCLYRMRCGCGRSWYELELKILVKCPACARLNHVHID